MLLLIILQATEKNAVDASVARNRTTNAVKARNVAQAKKIAVSQKILAVKMVNALVIVESAVPLKKNKERKSLVVNNPLIVPADLCRNNISKYPVAYCYSCYLLPGDLDHHD